jgi:hypothetical protein
MIYKTRAMTQRIIASLGALFSLILDIASVISDSEIGKSSSLKQIADSAIQVLLSIAGF